MAWLRLITLFYRRIGSINSAGLTAAVFVYGVVRSDGSPTAEGHMGKGGRAYEQVVAEVLKAMDPGASVQQGVWVVGPDGRRELDVLISGMVEGRPWRVLGECKDFDPEKTGPVGIAHVDALESKRRDLRVDAAFICSNAGFTADAIRKARRVGIRLIAVMKKGDERIRVSIAEENYFRKLKVQNLNVNYTLIDTLPPPGMSADVIRYNGIPVVNWAWHRTQILLFRENSIVNGTYVARHKFKQLTQLEIPNGTVVVNAIDLHLTISGGWFAQQITIDATSGVYDWLRRRVRPTPSSQEWQLHWEGVNPDAGTPINEPPESEFWRDLRRGEMLMELAFINGIGVTAPVPDIDALVVPADLARSIIDESPTQEASTSE